MTIILEPNEVTAASFSGVLGPKPRRVGSVTSLREVINTEGVPDTVVIGPGLALESALDEARRLRLSHPFTGVLLLRSRADATTLAEAMRAGVREVIAERDVAGLAEAYRRSAELTARLTSGGEVEVEESGKRGKVVTVFSPKGGCGKTTVATGLAVALAQAGQSTILVDLDLAFGDVPLTLGLSPTHSIANAMTITGRLDAASVQQMLTQHESGVRVLAAPPEPATREQIDSDLIETVLGLARSLADYVIVDTAPSLDDHSLTALEQSDRVLMLTTPDAPAIKNVKISLETLRVLGFAESRLDIVLNRSDAKVGIDDGDVSKLLRHEIALRVPGSREVPLSANRGRSIVSEYPRSGVSKALTAFVHHHLLDADADAAARRWGSRRKRSA